jgi:polysaccharide export outer membrane protein
LALSLAGALQNEKADRDEAYLIRDNKVHPFSIAAMVSKADSSADFILEQGDHVVVPSIRERLDFVYVFGQVMHPGRIEMDHEKRFGARGQMTLMGAVGMAGGVNEATVDCDRICVFRGGWRDLHVFHLGVNELNDYGESIALEPGDRVFVAASKAAQFNMGLNQFLPFLSGASSAVSLVINADTLRRVGK